MKYLKMILVVIMITFSVLMAGCGNSGSGAESPAGSLTLVTDRNTLNSGDSIVGTVTLTAVVAGKPVNGLEVWIRSSDNTVIADTSGITNTTGKANIVLKAKSVTASRTITLIATMKGVTQSTSVQVTVTPHVLPTGPTLTVNLPESSAAAFKAGGYLGTLLLSGTNIQLVDANSNPIAGQVVSLFVDSITGQQIGERGYYEPTTGNQITAPPGVLTVTTDSNGSANIPIAVEMYVPGVAGTENNMVINWHAMTIYLGQTITVSGQSAIKFTAS